MCPGGFMNHSAALSSEREEKTKLQWPPLSQGLLRSDECVQGTSHWKFAE